MNANGTLDLSSPPPKLATNARDWTGLIAGALTILRPYDRANDGHIRWLCECKCGKLTAVSSQALKRAKSCGCVTRWEGHTKAWPKPVKEHAPQVLPAQYHNIKYETRNALQLGDIGEHIVCADLLLAGWNAYQAAQGLPYDVVADVGGRLFRIAVKSTAVPRRRLPRNGEVVESRATYRFSFRRASRRKDGKMVVKSYTSDDVDLVAMVALDIRQVAYMSLSASKSLMEIFAPHGAAGTNRMGPKDGGRKRFELLTFDKAVDDFMGEAR